MTIIDLYLSIFQTISVSLSVVGSGGNLGAIDDTRLQAGAQSTSVTNFPQKVQQQV